VSELQRDSAADQWQSEIRKLDSVLPFHFSQKKNIKDNNSNQNEKEKREREVRATNE